MAQTRAVCGTVRETNRLRQSKPWQLTLWLWAREGWSARCITRAPSTSIAAETALGAGLATGTVDEALLRLLFAEAAAELANFGLCLHTTGFAPPESR
jgi:hypothetical protein